MSSRVADSLYWMSRYLERADHTTRLLDVNLVFESSPPNSSFVASFAAAVVGKFIGIALSRQQLKVDVQLPRRDLDVADRINVYCQRQCELSGVKSLHDKFARFGACTARKHGSGAAGAHAGPGQAAQDGAGRGPVASF